MMGKRVKVSKILVILFFMLFSFVFLQFISPIVLPTDSISNLSGMTCVINNKEKWDVLSHPWHDIYCIGDVLCHTKDSRSFFLNQNQLPFCSRCTAIWIGLSIGICIMIFFKIKKYILFLSCFLGSIFLLGFDGIGQLLGFWESTNFIRLVTGLLVGIFTGFAISFLIEELKVWAKRSKEKEG